MSRLSPADLKTFQATILSWYAQNKRNLPWRTTSDPYAILVSEVMSQQTQIARVVPKYLSWMEAFPTVASLAQASVGSVLMYWSGLGYNRRALNLQKAAQTIVNSYNGGWPTSPQDLEKLPGIGKYTASAVACFAFNAQIPVIDTNVRKVILVEFFLKRHSGKQRLSQNLTLDRSWTSHGHRLPSGDDDLSNVTEKEIEEFAWKLLPVSHAKDWNQALMDYARAMLKKEKIPIPKQSKFVGSNRWYRGGLLKIITKQPSITLTELATIWNKDHKKEDYEWFETLLSSLEKEGFIQRNGEKISLR